MTKPNYQAMTRKELLAYMRENRNDDEAFYAYMDVYMVDVTPI